nr:protein SpAN-like [Lytechinus pictus]
MGFWREELRSDRDMYVTIHLENAIAGTSSAFSKKEGAGYSTFDIPYDYSSIVHSPSTASSVNGLPTITTLDPLDMPYLGQRVAPTFYDLKKLNAAYCQDTIETNCSSTNPCLYEGYQRGDCTCACKPGFTNSTCGDEIPNFESRCIHRYTIDDGRMGSISSPNYSSNYDPNVICQYIITGPVGSTMSVSFTDFILHLPGASCDTDYLQIFLTNTSYVADFTLCGTNTPEAFVSPSNVIRFVFFSDSAETGFSLMYAFNTSGVPREEVCNATLTESSGELSYSASGSTTSAYCTYDIIAPERQRVALTVDSIKVQNSFCCVNRMEIHLGDGNWNPIQFCDETVISKEIISADNKMQIVFALEENSSGSASFSVTYRTVEITAGPSDPGVSFGCERTVEEDGGYIQSPRYPMTYPKMTCCEYEIIASPGLHVELTFQERFLIEEEDTLTIAFGGSMLVRIVLTGNAAPKGSYISLSDRMRIKFESNKSWFYGIGFRAFFKSVSVDIPAVPSTTMESISSHSDPTGPIMI